MNRLICICFILLLAASFTACNAKEDAKVNTIDARQAKEMIEENPDIIILDVRTKEEFDEGHIQGSILIPDYEIEEKAAEILTDPSAAILVYCRSGRRSKEAAKTLTSLGYRNIYDFGGIIDWPYEIVTDEINESIHR